MATRRTSSSDRPARRSRTTPRLTPRASSSETVASRRPGARATRSARARISAARDETGATKARTVVYIHGIGNKPEETVLRCQWDRALMGFPLGERSRMAYWCQVDRHGPPEVSSCADADAIGGRALHSGGIGARAIERAVEQGRSLNDVVEEIATSKTERDALTRLLAQMDGGATPRRGAQAKKMGAQGLEDLNVFNPLTKIVTGLFLKDVHDFFFDHTRRAAMKARLLQQLKLGNGPFVVIAHSQGSMIAYSVLQELGDAAIDVRQFITIGSPLGLGEVRDQLRKINGLPRGILPTPRCVTDWLNVYDPRDVVAQDESLAHHYRGDATPVDVALPNPEGSKDTHSATGYLSLPTVRSTVREAVDLERFQRLAPFRLAADVTTDFERARLGERRSLLIELTDPVWAKGHVEREGEPARGKRLPDTREAMADEVVKLIRRVAPEASDEDLRLQRLTRWVSVSLTRDEAQRLASSDALDALGLAVEPLYHVWRNAKKIALLDKSIHVVQASAAHQAYDALGQDIQWAVLDSGCTPHPHFDTYKTVVARWDCTRVTNVPVADGAVATQARRWRGRAAKGDTRDGYGHGTHVAGIIAGAHPPHAISGIAPKARLHIYKVLDDRGEGEDAWIIKALDHIASVNEKAGGPAIAGVNLSLGGEFEQGVFGCGHTPLCDELRRLWRQGVVVVIAVGNEGYRRLIDSSGEFGANMPSSVGDPANLEEAIAVGAVHKDKPHTYGVSHFSSRGPTADGRSKPDCVAPGEKILSCRHDLVLTKGATPSLKQLYYKLDGTSMAAPHVSGLIAAFLSRRREFIGQPDKVKQILLDCCTDLGRDRALQGHGMPNLVKMLVQT